MTTFWLPLFLLWQGSTPVVEQWETHEIVLRGVGTYSEANPFQDVTLQAQFSHSGGTQITVEGFHDGDGVGGQTGDVWKVRFMPTLAGGWSWTTTSNDAQLNGASGSLTATAPSGDNHGPLVRSTWPHLYLPNADGSQTFLFGLWTDPYQWDVNEREGLYDYLEANDVTRVYSYSGYADEKFVGSDFYRYKLNHFLELDQSIRDLQDHGVQVNLYLYTNDWEVQDGMLDAHDEPYLRFMMARYACFRNVQIHLTNQVDWHYGGYKSEQVERNSSMQWGDSRGTMLGLYNPYQLLTTTHHPGEDGDRSIGGAWFLPQVDQWFFGGWSDYIQKQVQATALSAAVTMTEVEPYSNTLNERGLARMNSIAKGLRTSYNQPVHLDEFSFECDGTWDPSVPCALSWKAVGRTGTRKTFWTVAASGASGATALIGSYELVTSELKVSELQARGTMNQLGILVDTLDGVPFWEMEPTNGILSPLPVNIDGVDWRSTFCISKARNAYLVYLLNGGEGSISLGVGVTYDSWLINPRTGARTSLGVVNGGSVSFAVPESFPLAGNHNTGSTDWVLLYQKQHQGPTAAAASSDFRLAAGGELSFDGSASSDPDNFPIPLVHSWDFGDGQARAGAQTAHTFTSPGVYDVQLAVSDGDRATLAQLPVPIAVGTDSLFRDGFGDGKLDDWSKQLTAGGAWLSDGRLLLNGFSTLTWSRVGVDGMDPVVHADVSVSALVQSDGPGGWVGVGVRKTAEQHRATDSGYLAFLRPDANGTLSLFVGDPVAGVTLATALTQLDPIAAPVELRLEARGTNLRVFAGGTLWIDVDDTTFSAPGYVSLGSSSQRASLDDVDVRSLAPFHSFATPEPNTFSPGEATLTAAGTPTPGGGFKITISGLGPNQTNGVLFSGGTARDEPGVRGNWFTWPMIPLVRHGLRTAGGAGTITYELDAGELYLNGQPPTPGTTRVYQFWYRHQDPSSNPDGEAFSDVLRVTFE
jgi:hypothetical protein